MQKHIGKIVYLEFPNGNLVKYEIIDFSFVYRKQEYLYILRCLEQGNYEITQIYESALTNNSKTKKEYLNYAAQLLRNKIHRQQLFMKKIDNLTVGL